MKVYNCINCGTEAHYGRSKVNKYCSNKCQAEYRSSERISEWLNGTGKRPRDSSKQYILNEQNGKCALCGMGQIWNCAPLIFVLDHIDGNSENDVRSNIRVVCPNCDSQLPTFKSRNNGNGRHSRRKRYREGKSY